MELASTMLRAIVVFPCVEVLVRESGYFLLWCYILVTSYQLHRLCGCLVFGNFAVPLAGCSKRHVQLVSFTVRPSYPQEEAGCSVGTVDSGRCLPISLYLPLSIAALTRSQIRRFTEYSE